MAKNKRTVEVDFTNVSTKSGLHIAEGEYGMKVLSADLGVSGAGNNQIEWVFKGIDGDAKNKTFYFYTPLVQQALWKLRQTLEALGVDTPDSVTDIDLDELVGLECTGIVEDDEYQGQTRSKLVSLISGESEEPKSKKKSNGKVVKVSEDEVKDMSEDELESLVDKHDLGVDLSDYKILRKKMAAVIAALEENNLLES